MELEEIIRSVIEDNAKIVDQIKAGKEKAINQLVGSVLKQDKTQDPKDVMSELRLQLGLKELVKKEKVIRVCSCKFVAPGSTFTCKKCGGDVPLVQTNLGVLETEHEGGTLYQLTTHSTNTTIKFTLTDVMNDVQSIPENIRRYIKSCLINS